MSSVDLPALWQSTRERLQERGLWGAGASLSLRVPGEAACWWGSGLLAQRIAFAQGDAAAALDLSIYTARADVGAILRGGGPAGRALAGSGLALPQLFDEQARHLGPFGRGAELPEALRARGQWLAREAVLVCLAPTAQRLALNAELAEKCATAGLLAWGAGGTLRPLPWWVRLIANRRLRRDARRAAQRFAQGLMPEESRGY